VQQQPTIIVQASGEKDVATALRFAQKEGLRLTCWVEDIAQPDIA
jgi:hypothetical protein